MAKEFRTRGRHTGRELAAFWDSRNKITEKNINTATQQNTIMKKDINAAHREISPKGIASPADRQAGQQHGRIYDNEILIDVQTLNIDSASFTQISNQAGGDKAKIAEIMLDIVEKQGKHRNPVTGSSGMLLGTVEKIGDALVARPTSR